MIKQENAKHELFRLRCKYGKTQEEVATWSKVARATVNRIEKGQTEILQAGTFFKLNTYFKSLGEKDECTTTDSI